MTARDELIEAGARALRHAFYPHDELHVPIDETLWWTYARLVLEAFEATYKESLQVDTELEALLLGHGGSECQKGHMTTMCHKPHITSTDKENTMTTISELQKRIGEINTANGWRDDEPGFDYDTLPPRIKAKLMIAELALIDTETSEAIEELRNGSAVGETYYMYDDGEDKAPPLNPDGSPRKPEGVPSELADVVIRALDFADKYSIDLEAMIEEKLTYNQSRGYRHGGKTA